MWACEYSCTGAFPCILYCRSANVYVVLFLCHPPYVCAPLRYAGFKEVRMIASKGVAFVEYDNEAVSTVAMLALNNYRLSESAFLTVTYAKR